MSNDKIPMIQNVGAEIVPEWSPSELSDVSIVDHIGEVNEKVGIKVIIKSKDNHTQYFYESQEVIRIVGTLLTDLMQRDVISSEAIKINQAVIKRFTEHQLTKGTYQNIHLSNKN